jgi:hypothetical protein
MIMSESKDIELTKEEAKQLEQAFNDKSFRQLLSEYVTELSDPKNREETEGNFCIDDEARHSDCSKSSPNYLFTCSVHPTAGRAKRASRWKSSD